MDSISTHQLRGFRDKANTSRCPETITEPCYMSSLPRELRDMIYHYLWEATPIIDPDSAKQDPWERSRHYIVYGDFKEEVQSGVKGAHLPAWLLTSRTFLEEGVEMLQSRGSWIFEYDNNELPGRYQFGLLKVSSARQIYIDCLDVSPALPNAAIKSKMFKDMQGANQMRKLDVGFSLEIDSFDDALTELPHEDIDLLEQLKVGFPHLTEVVIRIEKDEMPSDMISLDNCHNADTCTRHVYDVIPAKVQDILGRDMRQDVGGMR